MVLRYAFAVLSDEIVLVDAQGLVAGAVSGGLMEDQGGASAR